jgi:hypothetical protein
MYPSDLEIVMSNKIVEPIEGQSHWCDGTNELLDWSFVKRPCRNIVRNDSDHCEAGHPNAIRTKLAHHAQVLGEPKFPTGVEPRLSPETDEVSCPPTVGQSHGKRTRNIKAAFASQVLLDCRGGHRIPLRLFRPLYKLTNGIEILQYCEQRTRSISQGRALHEMAIGCRVPAQWPPRESYEYRHLLAVRRIDDEIQILGSLEDEGQRPTYAQIGADIRRIPLDEAHWVHAVGALLSTMAD